MELIAGILTGVHDEFLVWAIAGAAGVLGLATVANIIEHALDLETT